ncbi:MAG: hypothetical protein PHV36_06625 [Elusimicrobiales bacterium]|nr:hypothetical protein [Elusimicrobiales bacterium]
MKFFILAALALCFAGPAAAAFEDEGLTEAAASTETVKSGDEDEDLALIQQSDEDLAAFVTDYIRKDMQLKGAFLIEDKASKKIYRLALSSIEPKAEAGENGGRIVSANFKDAAGKKVTVAFHLQNGPWGGLDIFKLELKSAPLKAAPAGEKRI